MTPIEEIKEELKNMLSDKRYEHSIGVMEKAAELAEFFKEDVEKAALVGLTHDMAKEMTNEESLKYIKDNNLILSKYDMQVPSSWHGIIAADMVGKKYGFTKDMQDAIACHTVCRENMTFFDKLLYVADKAEERTRSYNDLGKYNRMIKEQGVDAAILYVLDKYTIPKSLENQKLIHPNSIYVRNEIIEKLNQAN